ncbi:MAG: prepilin-type N-terminal cleavage/methylation domain-containing protein [Planctomycetota bacterium]
MTRNRTEGFTLLEILVSLSVLSIGLLSLAGTMMVSDSLRLDSEISYQLHMLAANRVELLKDESSSVTGYMMLYPGGMVVSSVDPASAGDLPVTNLTELMFIQPTNLGVERSAVLGVAYFYIDPRGNPRTQSVITMVNKELP